VAIESSAESLILRLTQLQERCERGSFQSLSIPVEEFCTIADEIANLEGISKSLIPLALSASANLLFDCVRESYDCGFLEESQESVTLHKGKTRLGSLSKSLHTPELRARVLYLLVTSSLGLACLDILAAQPADVIAWRGFVHCVREFPVLARFAPQHTWGLVRDAELDARHGGWQQLREMGYEGIDLGMMYLTEYDAWRDLIQAANTREQQVKERKLLLQDCAAKLGAVANFLLFVDTSPWTIKPFYKLEEGLSLTAIVQALNRTKLHRPAAEDAVYGGLFSREIRPFEVTTGLVRRKTYLLRLPASHCFYEHGSLKASQEWNHDPLAVMRKNVSVIPVSSYARKVKLDVERVQALILDDKLEEIVGRTFEELGPDALALLVVKSVGLPDETAPLFVILFRRLLRARSAE
jgi:hypothetical protein